MNDTRYTALLLLAALDNQADGTLSLVTLDRMEALRAALAADAAPVESDPCACRKAAPGMWTSGYDPAVRDAHVRHGKDACRVYLAADAARGSCDCGALHLGTCAIFRLRALAAERGEGGERPCDCGKTLWVPCRCCGAASGEACRPHAAPAPSPAREPAPADAAHGGERAQALEEDEAPARTLRRRVESLAARYGATRRDITFAGQQVAETLRSLLIYPSAECPATVTGNPIDCGGCPEHAAPAAAPSPEASPAPRAPADAEFCGKSCDHGSPCLLYADHQPPDRHETQHGCIFFDPRAPGDDR